MSVTLFQDIDFRGRHKHIIGRDEPNLHADGWGDAASSIHIASGLWEFWEHVSFAGARVVLGPGSYRWVEDVGIPNDSLSSVRPIPPVVGLVPTPGLILYEHVNFEGEHKHIVGWDEPDLHADGWGDRTSSFQIINGTWRFSQHVGNAGWSSLLAPGSYAWVEDVGIPNDELSSVRRSPPAGVSMPTRELILYEHIDYGGDHKHLINRGTGNLHADGWGDRVSSFQVISGSRWVLWEHVSFSGAQINPQPGSYPWIEAAGMVNDTLSSVRANVVPVFFKVIQGATANVANNVQSANQVYGASGIELLSLGTETNTAPNLLDLDQPTCSAGQVPTAEETDLFEFEREHVPREMVGYYVRSTNLGVAGCAAFPANRPGFVVTNAASPWTAAHEVGHVLGLAHVTDNTNVMFTPTANIVGTPGLTNAQVTTISGSQLLV